MKKYGTIIIMTYESKRGIERKSRANRTKLIINLEKERSKITEDENKKSNKKNDVSKQTRVIM